MDRQGPTLFIRVELLMKGLALILLQQMLVNPLLMILLHLAAKHGTQSCTCHDVLAERVTFVFGCVYSFDVDLVGTLTPMKHNCYR